MVTELGIFLRKLRLDEGEDLSDMARKIGVSTSFLSAVETGKKNMPEQRLEDIISVYDIRGDKENEIRFNYYISVSALSIDFSNLNKGQKRLALIFREKLPELSDEEVKVLEDMVNYPT